MPRTLTVLWLALTISAFGGAVYCALTQYYRYNSEPVVVSLQRDYRSWWTTFPAVTACFLDRVHQEKASQVIERIWNVTEESNPDKFQYYMDFIELVADVSFRDNLQNFWKYQTDDTVEGIDLLELALSVHPNWTLGVSVSLKDHEVVWHPVMTEVGMCLSFNSAYAQYQHMRQDMEWSTQPLLQCHYHSGQCYVRVESLGNAVRYFVHSPYEISTAISNPTGEVLPGEELIIDYKVVEIQSSPSVRNLRTEQRRCKYPDEWIADSIRVPSFYCTAWAQQLQVLVAGLDVDTLSLETMVRAMISSGSKWDCAASFCEQVMHTAFLCVRCTAAVEWLSFSAVAGHIFTLKEMATCATRMGWRASGAMLKSSSIYPRISPSVLAFPNVPSSIITHTQRRSLFVLPYGLDVGLMSITAYFMTKLKKPDSSNVFSVFGPEPGSKEGEEHPDRVIRCIAHRGAGLDAPENTLEAFKYCVNHDCNMVELDVRTSKDGKLVLLHDEGLQRLTGSNITNVHVMDWDSIKNIDVGFTHPNRAQFKEVHLCLLDEALDYLLENKVKVIIDVKGDNKQVISGILNTFSSRPDLYKSAAITCFNPFVLYQIRKRDPEIVGALSYRPYCFSAQDYDAEQGAHNPRYGDNLIVHAALRTADVLHSLLWRWCARWCSVSAVLLHKDIVSPTEIYYWRSLGIRCAGWCVNRPLEKLYWRGVLKAPYLANTLLGEPEVEKSRDKDDYERAGPLIDKLLEPERRMSSGQN